jgi:hypothetical protein
MTQCPPDPLTNNPEYNNLERDTLQEQDARTFISWSLATNFRARCSPTLLDDLLRGIKGQTHKAHARTNAHPTSASSRAPTANGKALMPEQ